MNFSNLRIPINLFFFLAMTMVWPSSVLAVQQHGGAEGLVAHQMGHGLFVFGIIYLLYKIEADRFKSSGWGEFKVFLWLLILWNFLTFAGHWMREFVDQSKFSKIDGYITSMTIHGPWDFFFYLTRLDHLLLVPAFVLLLLALRKWRMAA